MMMLRAPLLLLALWLITPSFAAAQSVSLADAVDAPQLTWTTGGNALWLGQTNITFDAQDAAASSAITNAQESWIETTITGPATVIFWWKVSSEANFDFLELHTNGVRSVLFISGEVDWEQRVINLGTGAHTLRWRYVKDASVAAGQDRAWLDQISFTVPDRFIATQPLSQYKNAGSTATFSVSATGTTPLAYQWQFEGVAIPAETNAALVITNLDFLNAGSYRVIVSNASGSLTSQVATLTVPSSYGLSLLHYNVKGNGALDWSTNAAQVRAIGRQLSYLNPDVISFNEIPVGGLAQMPNFVAAFLPGYYLATNSTSDGFIQSAIASRYPINRSQSWLARTNLAAFGYNGAFTRDLFEAEIVVPGQPQPLHVFTTHAKAATDATSLLRRAAEARAISNLLVTVFLPNNSGRFYVLTGDLNEDIFRPPSGSQQPIQILTSVPTGLKLLTPINRSSGQDFTLSIQAALNVRFDYILPSQGLNTNLVRSQIFRTDLLPTLPAPLLAGDSLTASDHLPVHIEFRNPYAPPLLPTLTQAGWAAGGFGFNLKGRAGRAVIVEASTNLQNWLPIWTNTMGTGATRVEEATTADQRFYRARAQ